jgi:NADH-ubiquinone oxidoreductase chain 1
MIFYIAAVAETNRAPFDLAEAESELVSGFMTEHSAGIFVFFFLAEYASIILICILISIVFLGGYEILGLFTNTLDFVFLILNIIYTFIITMLDTIISKINSFFFHDTNPFILRLLENITNSKYFFYDNNIVVNINGINFNVYDHVVNFNIYNLFFNDIVSLYDIFSNNNTLSLFYPSTLGIKSFTLVFLFILIRASYPRLRFDKLMSCC